MDRLTSMRIFTRVVDLGSYSAVASEEGISAQMVGKHVLGLEQWLGGKLFHKTTRQQTLTELGQLFLARCQRVLEELALTESLTQNLLAEPAGRLRIAAPLSFGHHRLVPLLPAFIDRYPKLDLDLQLTPRWVDLVEEGFDAAIRTLRPQDEALIARPLLTDPALPPLRGPRLPQSPRRAPSSGRSRPPPVSARQLGRARALAICWRGWSERGGAGRLALAHKPLAGAADGGTFRGWHHLAARRTGE